MAGRYRPYQSYRPSEVRWLDDVPSGWEIRRTKRVLELKRTKVGKSATDFQLLSLTLNGIIPRDITDGSGKIPAEFDTYQEVSISDLVFCLFDIDETPRTIGISNNKGMITGAYNVYKCWDDADARFYYYYFLHLDSFKGLRPFYTGLRKVVRSDTFDNIPVPCPSLPEQTQIAAFLDHETAKIDALIAKQQRLIALLEEKRQAVISHAVTKGLNPDAPLRPSGIDWLGNVPTHWEVESLKHIGSVTDCKHITADFVDDGFPLASIAEVKGWIVDLATAKKTTKKFYDSLIDGGRMPVADDIIYSRNATVGAAAIVKKGTPDFAMGQDVCLIRLFSGILPMLVLHILKSKVVEQQLELAMIGSTFKRVNVEDIRNFRFAIPPIDEQATILTELEKISSKFATLIAKANAAAVFLKERRTALISAAVTGKIDVRDWTPPEAKDQAA